MKKYPNTFFLPLLILALSIIGAVLRGILYATGLDEKGLLLPFQLSHILLWVVTLGAAAIIFVFTHRLQQANKYRFNFPASLLGAIGAGAAAIGFCISSVLLLNQPQDLLGILTAVGGFLSAVALGFLAYLRKEGRHPSAIFSIVICAFFMVRIIYCYKTWSANPQLQDYLFPLLANISAMLACYCDATFTDGEGKRRNHCIFHLATVYCAVVSVPACDSVPLYLCLAVWMVTSLCNLTPMPKTFEKTE